MVVYHENAAFDSQFPDTLTEPLILLEVLSATTKNTDLTTKRAAYFKLSSVTDYLIIWQDKIRLDQFTRVRQSGNEPQLKHHLNRNLQVRLDALNIEFTLGDLYRRLDDLPEGAL